MQQFKSLFTEEVKIKSIDKDRYVEIKEAEDKLGIMDLRAELSNGNQCNIEVQLDYLEYENERRDMIAMIIELLYLTILNKIQTIKMRTVIIVELCNIMRLKILAIQ